VAFVKAVEIREMKSPELRVELERLRRHLFDLRAQAVTEKLTNPHQLKAVRKDMARILTVLRDRGEKERS
jgi:large subunit ribosomal protein L29